MVLAGVASCGRHGFDPLARTDAAACAVTLAPATTRVNTASEQVFTPSGGLAPYRFAATGPAGIDAATGLLTTGDEPGVVTITTTDDAGCTAQATATIAGVYSTDGTTWRTETTTLPPRKASEVAAFTPR